MIRRAGSGGNRNDIVRHDVRGNETHLVHGIDSDAVIHHERNQANGDIEVVAAARNRGTHQSRPEDPRSKPVAARVHHHLFRYPFGLAVSKIEKLHVLVQVGLIQDFLHRPAEHESSGDVVEAFGTSFERESQDLVGPEHVRVTHPVVVEQVVYGCAVVEHGVDFIREEIPDVRRQAELWLAEISANGNHASLEHLHQAGRARPHGFHGRPQSLRALMLVGSPDENMDLRARLFQQTLHQERSDEAGAAREQHMIQDR